MNTLSRFRRRAHEALAHQVWQSAPFEEITPTLPSFPERRLGGEKSLLSAEKRRRMTTTCDEMISSFFVALRQFT
jgi:hypothetical protein